MGEYIKVFDKKLKTERDITRKMQAMMPQRFQVVGESSTETQKKSTKDAEPAADEGKTVSKKPKIIRKDEV